MSTSHWYPRYIGDYHRKTSHLTILEHGAYVLLLDWYYANGKPIPLDLMQMHRICRAFAQDEQQAIANVLNEFFEKTADGWVNSRADKEIVKKAEVSDKRARAASKRWCNSNALASANGHAKGMLSTTTTTNTHTNVWQFAIDYLGESKRPLVGKWIKEHGDQKVSEAIEKCMLASPVDPPTYISGILKAKAWKDLPQNKMPSPAGG